MSRLGHIAAVTSRFAARGLGFLLPQRCAMCAAPARERSPLCDRCFAAIPRWTSPLCVRCLLLEREPVGCTRHVGWFAHAAWLYEERAAEIVRAIKFHGRRRLAGSLAGEVSRALPRGSRFDAILTVPLHHRRARERGYNQVAPLASGLADLVGAPYVARALERTRHTPPQTRLHGSARRRNLHDAFRLRRPVWFAGRRVMVVDDVITTGATMAATMQALHDAGSTPVGVSLAWAQ